MAIYYQILCLLCLLFTETRYNGLRGVRSPTNPSTDKHIDLAEISSSLFMDLRHLITNTFKKFGAKNFAQNFFFNISELNLQDSCG